MERPVVRRKGKPNRGGGRGNHRGGRGGRGRGRGRGDARGRGAPRGGGGGWSSSRKGGLDLDDSLDGPVVSSSSYREPPKCQGYPTARGRGGGSKPKVKLEMQRLFMSQENQDLVKETLCALQTESFSSELGTELDMYEDDLDEPEYDELDFRAEDQYWISDRNLVLEDVHTFRSSGDLTKASEKPEISKANTFAVEKLQRCGFSRELCSEALALCDDDVGAALEYLLCDLYNITLPVKGNDDDDDDDDENGEEDNSVISQEILDAREEEKMALESIYDKFFEERIANRIWVVRLELPQLIELVGKTKSSAKPSERDTKSRGGKKTVCPFYLKGHCKFRDRCRYSHSRPDDNGQDNDLSHPIYANLKALEEAENLMFTVEIRFPEGNKYPEEPPLVAFSSTLDSLPPHTRLNISQYLMSQAREAAEDHLPCVFTMVSSLEDKSKLEELVSLPPPRQSQPVSSSTALSISKREPHPPKPVSFGKDNYAAVSSSTFESSSSQGDKRHDRGDAEYKDRWSNKSSSIQSERSSNASTPSAFYPQRKKDAAPRKSDPVERKKQNRLLQDDFKRKQTSKAYQGMLSQRQRLPAWDMQDLVTEVIRDNQVVVISGMTGCGKTTQVPQFLLDEALQQKEFSANIVCTQPRRISAMAVSQRVADERCEKLGKSVGYQIRLESVMSPQTRLLFCTTGIILRRLEGDPMLEDVSHIIIDEVHERSEESDFLLMILRDVLYDRPDLKVILMSATVNAELFSNYFGGCPVLEIPGRTYPVQQFFLEDAIEFTKYCLEERSPYSRPLKQQNYVPDYGLDLTPEELEELTMNSSSADVPKDSIRDMNLNPKQMRMRYPDYSHSTIKTMATMDMEKINNDLVVSILEWIVLGKHEFPKDGAILIFMPGFAEIQALFDLLMSTSEFGHRSKNRYKIIPLHSTLSSEDQNAVFRKPPEGVTKIVIATNIAETSITIDDIVYVVDAGRMKEKRYDQTKSMESLETVWVSRANAQQRRGRAGRVKEGICFHLFTSHCYQFHMREQPIPEIQRAPLEQLVLKIKMLPIFSEQDVEAVLEQLIEAPSLEAIHGAVKRLQDLGALDEQVDLSPLGYHLGSMPVDVRIGKLMLFGAIFRCLDPTLTIAATLSFKSPFVSPFGSKQEADEKKKEFAMGNSDYLTMLNAYKGWTEAKKRGSHQAYLFCQENYLSIKTLQMLASLKQQYVELLSDIGFIRSGLRLRDVERAGKNGSDGVAEATGLEANVNSSNWKLISGMLVAALYPNIVQVLTPDTRYHASSAGAVVRAPTADELKFKTHLDGYVHVHPSSVNFQVCYYSSPYLVYHEKVKTSKVYIRDSSMVSVYPLLLFGGGSVSIDLYQGNFILSLDEGWIQFMAASPQIAELVRELRHEMDRLLEDKICNPDMDLLTCPRGSKIINCIVTLISSQ